MFGRTTIQMAIRNILHPRKTDSMLEAWTVRLPHEELPPTYRTGGKVSDYLRVALAGRRYLKQQLRETGTMDKHLDLQLKNFINRDSIMIGSGERPAALAPTGYPFFTNAMEADRFYYPDLMEKIAPRGMDAELLCGDDSPYMKFMELAGKNLHVERVTTAHDECAWPRNGEEVMQELYKHIPLIIRPREDIKPALVRGKDIEANGKTYATYTPAP